MKWNRKKVLVTGGASFIGSHLVEGLINLGAKVIVADNFTSGRMENLQDIPNYTENQDSIEIYRGDLCEPHFTDTVMKDVDMVFHLAASHGGRGYIDTHPVECCTNMALDQTVFWSAFQHGVERICFASSACVYPTHLQERDSNYLLKEEDADPFMQGKANADKEYGWTKLMAEMTLKAYHAEYRVKTSSVRIFTAYGERENETHAIIALIAKAFIKMDPYEIWGDGNQTRNFTYVKDIVRALVLAAEKIEDGTPVNAGTAEHINVRDVAEKIFDIVGWRPTRIAFDTTKPTGVYSRAADGTRALQLLGWQPRYSFDEGLKRNIEWYFRRKDKKQVSKDLHKLLYERYDAR